MSESSYEWINCLSLDSVEDAFESLPSWLKDSVASSDLVLPWLPISLEELNSRTMSGNCENYDGSSSQVGEGEDVFMNDVLEEINIDDLVSVHLEPEIQKAAVNLKAQVADFQATSKTIGLVNEIRELCLDKGGDSLTISGLIEPWLADDEIASVVLSHLTSRSKEELTWPSQVLCSVILPKLLVLEEPASRLLVTAMVEYRKLHQRACEYALLFPLIL
ncbi:hypothetical protein DVH24_029430 [Malus domestica]|uniref:Fanconi Anaemia group E protein C-terminal domain-containing protein n=1 Tax=Malus domestica TaxID=3750 RepID=A0A498HVL9_MALDO|nr:hypothetical protein DVH24_029430 [Malus domestica]